MRIVSFVNNLKYILILFAITCCTFYSMERTNVNTIADEILTDITNARLYSAIESHDIQAVKDFF
ncbi:hypothetical protein KG892_02695 [Vermiphilus pyriformis]|nr:MAG: hypothetical protein KG892_02695 [Vermiphilus pyriformis]